MKAKLDGMRKEANSHQTQTLEQIVQNLSESKGLNSTNIQEAAHKTEQKESEIMKIYLGDEPDSSEAIEFLCLAEGGEVTHYEVLSAMAKIVKDRKFSTRVGAILKDEKKHLMLCTRLAKQIAVK